MNNQGVLKELQPILDASPVIDLENDFAFARAIPVPETSECKDVIISTRTIKGPETELAVRIYEPANRSFEAMPCLFWSHGGGYILGAPNVEDGICQRFVMDAGCVVIQADYRLAPEHTFPAAIEDSYAGLKWVSDNADELKIDKSKIAIAGPSAGGGLTAALALMARDRGGPELIFQMPLYPMLDNQSDTSSSHEITMKTMPKAWNRENNLTAWQMYLGNKASEPVSQYAAPARETNLAGLPPAYICVGQLDPFRDETLDYVARLARADVPVEFHLYPGCFHGFDAYSNKTEVCERTRTEYIEALKKAFTEANK